MRRRWWPSTFHGVVDGFDPHPFCPVCVRRDSVLAGQRVHVGVEADVLTGQHQGGAGALADIS